MTRASHIPATNSQKLFELTSQMRKASNNTFDFSYRCRGGCFSFAVGCCFSIFAAQSIQVMKHPLFFNKQEVLSFWAEKGERQTRDKEAKGGRRRRRRREQPSFRANRHRWNPSLSLFSSIFKWDGPSEKARSQRPRSFNSCSVLSRSENTTPCQSRPE